MPYNSRNGFTPLAIPDVLRDALPPDVIALADTYTGLVARWQDARAAIPVLNSVADRAEDADRLAAKEATRNGKAIPKPTEPAARQAAEEKTREAAALLDLAAEAEDDLVAAITGQRDMLTGLFRDRLDTAIAVVEATGQAFIDALDSCGLAVGAWVWARTGGEGLPRHPRPLVIEFGGVQQQATVFAGLAVERARREKPDAVEEREREWVEEQAAAARVPQAHGIVLDAAGYRGLE